MARRVAAHSGFCERFRVPNECRDLALLVSDLHTHIHIAFEPQPAALPEVFDKADAWRRPERFAQLLDACRRRLPRSYRLRREGLQSAGLCRRGPGGGAGCAGQGDSGGRLQREAIRRQLAKRRLDAISRVRDEWTFIESKRRSRSTLNRRRDMGEA